jgi:hypothetical protein
MLLENTYEWIDLDDVDLILQHCEINGVARVFDAMFDTCLPVLGDSPRNLVFVLHEFGPVAEVKVLRQRVEFLLTDKSSELLKHANEGVRSAVRTTYNAPLNPTGTEREVDPLADHDVHGRVDALGPVLCALEILIHA